MGLLVSKFSVFIFSLLEGMREMVQLSQHRVSENTSESPYSHLKANPLRISFR